MRRWNRWIWIATLLLGCGGGAPIQIQQVQPTIPFVPQTDWEWPLIPMIDGWMVGGSGYRSGHADPTGWQPGLGLGAVLIPSVQSGRLLGFPGPPLLPKRFIGPLILWQSPPPSPSPSPASTPSPSPVSSTSPQPSASPKASPTPRPQPSPIDLTGPLIAALTKVGPALVGVPQPAPLPKMPWIGSPWGPVTLQPGPLPPGVPLLNLGFPTADGTPEKLSYGLQWFFVRASSVEVVLLDLISRTLHRPPNAQGHGFQIITDFVSPIALVGPLRGIGRIQILDLLTGGYDTLPELPDVDATTILSGAHMTQTGAVIAFATIEQGHRRVHLFDRRTRLIDRLEHLNRTSQTFNPNIDWFGNFVLVTASQGKGTIVELYDVQTGKIDPLPAINTATLQSAQDLSVGARLLAYITVVSGMPEARIYDRLKGTIDTLPEVNRLGPMVALRLSNDGSLVAPIYVAGGQGRIALYNRTTGMIDPLPELNPPGVNPVPDLTALGVTAPP